MTRRLSAQQLVALAYPCLLAEETAHLRFGHRVGPPTAPRGTIVLTINTGYE